MSSRDRSALVVVVVAAMAVSGGSRRFEAQQVATPGGVHPSSSAELGARYAQVPLEFYPHAGRATEGARFMARGQRYTFYLTDEGADIVLLPPTQPRSAAPLPLDERPGRTSWAPPTVIRMRLVGGQPPAHVEGLDPGEARANYYVGARPDAWRTDVAPFGRVRYDEVYPGIDLVFRGTQRLLEYDFVVDPGGHAGRIAMRFDGARDVRIDASGDLVLVTDAGELRHRRPVAYQQVGDERRNVESRFALREDGVGFVVDEYDRRLPLVIDPVLAYGNYIGGSGDDLGFAMAADAAGNAYVAGVTASLDFPTRAAVQPTYGGGFDGCGLYFPCGDAFVTKLDPSGRVIYSTYLGGTGDDEAHGVAADASGNAYVTGITLSLDFPVTVGVLKPTPTSLNACTQPFTPLLPSCGGDVDKVTLGCNDGTFSCSRSLAGACASNGGVKCLASTALIGNAFVTKLLPTGGAAYSTYLGGDDVDEGYAIAVDGSGNAYVAGSSLGSLPIVGGFQSQHGSPGVPDDPNTSPIRDAFVAKINPTATAIVYSSYLGGNKEDIGFGIAVDPTGNAYIAGQTTSPNLATISAFQSTCAGNCLSPSGQPFNDAFVAKVNAAGNGLSYLTYLGGGDRDYGTAIAVDAAGSAYVTGSTGSRATVPGPSNLPFPTTPGAVQPTHGGSSYDAFVTKFSPDGKSLVYSTYLGGSGFDAARGITVDTSGSAYVGGYTTSTNFPLLDPLQPAKDNLSDAFVSVLNAAGSQLQFSTYLGGDGDDFALGWCCAVALDPSRNLFMTGGTQSANFPPVIQGASRLRGYTDAFVVEVSSTFPDTDGDGMPDWWERLFGLDPLVGTGADGPDGDPDGDGRSNSQEYAGGSHPRGFFTRYFAEGATTSLFETQFAVVNAEASSASVLLRFSNASGQLGTKSLVVDPNTRATVVANEVAGLTDQEFATRVESDLPVVADRTMRWDRSQNDFYGAHAETAITQPARTWYFAEGATHSNFALFYLVLNPNDVQANIEVEYLLPGGRPPVKKPYKVKPNSRENIWVNTEEELASVDVSAIVRSDVDVIVERAMYLTTPTQLFAAGHESAGVTAPATDWSLAEGATGDFFDLFVLVANPNDATAVVDATFLLPNGTVWKKQYGIDGKSRFNIWADVEEIPAKSGQYPLANTAVSTTIHSSIPVLVERAMWWPGAFETWYEAHNSFGATETGTKWALAEGECSSTRETFVLVANTSPVDGRIRVSLLFEDGSAPAVQEFDIQKTSRFNVVPPVQFPSSCPAGETRRFGMLVESLSVGGAPPAQITVERAMYGSTPAQFWASGTNALGTKLQ